MARKTALKRDPRVTTQPITTGNEQASGRVNPDRVAMERLSPGVYRSASGGLVSAQGRPIQRQPQPPTQPQPQPPMQPQAPMQSQAPMPSQFDAGIGDMRLQLTPEQSQQFNDLRSRGVNVFTGEPMDKMYREAPMYQPAVMPQMPQPSANMGGQYRLSPGVYGNKDQAMQQYNDLFQKMQMDAMQQYRKG